MGSICDSVYCRDLQVWLLAFVYLLRWLEHHEALRCRNHSVKFGTRSKSLRTRKIPSKQKTFIPMHTPFARLFPSARLMDWNMLVKHFRGWLHAIHGASGRIVFTHYYCNQSNRFGIVYIQTVRLPTYYHHQAHWNLERAVQIRRHQETMLDFELSLSHPSSSVCISRGLAKALVGLFFPIGWQLARANNYWMEHACWLAMPPIAYHNDSRRIRLNNKLDRIFTFFRDLKSEQAGCRVHGMLHWLLW